MVSVVAVIATVSLSAAACGSSGSPSGSGDAGGSPVEVTGTPLPEFTTGSRDPANGRTAPVLDGRDFAGATVRIGGTADDTRRIVVFLSHWCATCADQAKNLAEWLGKETVPSNVEVTVVATSTDRARANYPPSPFLEAAGLGSVRTLVDDAPAHAAHAYGITQLPTTVMLLPDDTVLGRLRQDLPSTYFATLAEALSLVPAGATSPSTPSATSPALPESTTSPLGPGTTATEPPAGGGRITADELMSMIGRPLTGSEVDVLEEACYRKFDFRQDIHCEDELGFGLSLDGDSVREVYLYNYYPPDQSSFPGALPGGVTWASTRSDIESLLGQPSCTEAIIGYNLHYTSGSLDVAYTVDSDGYPTARLQKITIRPLADRGAACR